jgi:hypothetical protein
MNKFSEELNGLPVTRLWSHNTEKSILKVTVYFQNMKSKLGAINRKNTNWPKPLQCCGPPHNISSLTVFQLPRVWTHIKHVQSHLRHLQKVWRYSLHLQGLPKLSHRANSKGYHHLQGMSHLYIAMC